MSNSMTVLPELSFQEISQYFHLPISQAAKELKVCETLLKKICRVNGIKRWPHRKIRSIDTMINLLEFRLQSEKLSEKERTRMRNEISDLNEKKSFFMSSPNTTYQSIIPKNTLQSFSKTKLKNQKSFTIFLHEEAKKPHSHLGALTTSVTGGISSVIMTNMRKSKRTRSSDKPEKQTEEDVNKNFDDRIEEVEEDVIEKSDKENKENLKRDANDAANLEKEEEEVLNVLYSLAKEKQKTEQTTPDSATIINNNENTTVNTVNNNTEGYPNELYKLSLVAILNPMNNNNNNKDEENNNNNNDNNNSGQDKSKELKMRNMLRRSMDSCDNQSNEIKKRKFDYEYRTNIEYSSDPNNKQFHHFSPNKLIKL